VSRLAWPVDLRAAITPPQSVSAWRHDR